MSLFTELKRRNVFRVGIAYLVVAWLVMQVADVVINNIEAPGWVFQVIMLVLGIGFPVVLVFAWAFELTPDGVRRESEVDRSQSIRQQTGHKLNRGIIVILVIALSYFVWESRFHQGAESGVVSETVAPAQPDIQSAPTKSKEQSVAVLPFVNMSSDPEQEYFSDGITEEIINALVKIPGLSVPARTSVFGFKGHQGDVRQIGQELSVAYILEGSIRSQAGQVRITAQLIKADDGYHLWSETFDRQLDNIFVVQEEIAAAIARVLVGKLDVDIATVPNKTVNMEAYDTYLNGRTLLRERHPDAIEVLERATQLDPTFVPAWAALALAYQIHGYYVASDAGLQEKAKQTARHALSLDPENVDALDALASAERDSWNWEAAEKLFAAAVAIDPQSVELLEDHAEFYCAVGNTRKCVEVSARGYALDPKFNPLALNYVNAIEIAGDYQESFDLFKQLGLGPDYELPTEDGAISSIGFAFKKALLSGDLRTATKLMQDFRPGAAFVPVKNAALKVLAGTFDKDDLDVLKATNVTAYLNAGWYQESIEGFMLAYAGEDEYLLNTTLDFTRQIRWGHSYHLWAPIWNNVRGNPRFQEILELYNLPEYWDEKGWPDFCQRIDAERIECE